jgi:hypothetical protein
MQRIRNSAMAAGAVVFLGAASAYADIGDPVIIFEASGSMGSGSYTVTLDDGTWAGDSWFWSLSQPLEIFSDSGELIVTLNEGACFIQEDPIVALGFAVTAGSSDTTFTITSSTVSFPTIEDAIGRASAGITLTESDGDTATLTGLQPGGAAYTANYNGSNAFTHLLAGPFTESDAFGSTSATDEFPGGGSFTLVGDVSDISSQWNFELSANDQASGTSVFVVVPTTGTLALAALGSIGMLRRRR